MIRGPSDIVGPVVTTRSQTFIGVFNWQSADGIIMGMQSGGSQLYLYMDGSQKLNIGGNLDFQQVDFKLPFGQKFLAGIVIDASGSARGFFGSPIAGGPVFLRFGPNAIATDSYSANIVMMNLTPGGSFPLDGAFERLIIYNSTLTDSQIRTAAQLVSAPYAGGAPTLSPAGAWAFYPLSTTSDLTDHSGNGRPACTLTGSNTNVTGIQQPPIPGSLLRNYVCNGDSLTYGTPNGPSQGYPVTLQSLDPTANVINAGSPGAIWDTTNAMQYNNFIDPTRDNLNIVNTGLNNFGAGYTLAQTEAQATDCINNMNAHGWPVLTMSLLPNGVAYTDVPQYNIDIATYGQAFGNLAIDPRFVPTTNLAVFQTDQTHLTSLGYTYMGSDIFGYAQSYFASFGSTPNAFSAGGLTYL